MIPWVPNEDNSDEVPLEAYDLADALHKMLPSDIEAWAEDLAANCNESTLRTLLKGLNRC